MKTTEYIGVALIALCILGFGGWGAASFFADPLIHIGLRALAGIGLLGFVLLLAYVVIDRVKKARREPDDIREVKH
ncbi:MAG: hypothetical protein U9N44_06685 [Chloroflexota bacterium]|nr:hypothetical protein [Chloroflexota bacterium]